MKMEVSKILKVHEERISRLEKSLKELLEKPDKNKLGQKFIFSNKNKNHNELLEELLKSDYCHSKNGLSREEILAIFKGNNRPIVRKKVNDLLNVWKKRNKIEAIKEEGILRYFWIEND